MLKQVWNAHSGAMIERLYENWKVGLDKKHAFTLDHSVMGTEKSPITKPFSWLDNLSFRLLDVTARTLLGVNFASGRAC